MKKSAARRLYVEQLTAENKTMHGSRKVIRTVDDKRNVPILLIVDYCFTSQISWSKVEILILSPATIAISLKKRNEEQQVCGILFTVNQHNQTKVFTILDATFNYTIVSITKQVEQLNYIRP